MFFIKTILFTIFLSFFYVTVAQAGILDGRVEPLTQQENVAIRQKVSKECGIDVLIKEGDTNSKNKDQVAYEKWLRRSKCAVACAFEKLGVTFDDKQINKKAINFLPELNLGDSRYVSKCPNEPLYEKCSHIEDPDRCEYAGKVFQCVLRACHEADNQERPRSY